MNEPTFGQLIPADAPARRDAVHIAVAPMTAGHTLNPGDSVGISSDGLVYQHRADRHDFNNIGVVDPYLKCRVVAGERFWLFLYPGTITSLRHEWTHPAFTKLPASSALDDSVAWVTSFAHNQLDLTYNRLMAAADLYVLDGDWTYDNTETYKSVDFTPFWPHYTIITGRKPDYADVAPFTCSC